MLTEREKFEAWAEEHPEFRYWNTSDAAFSAWCGRAIEAEIHDTQTPSTIAGDTQASEPVAEFCGLKVVVNPHIPQDAFAIVSSTPQPAVVRSNEGTCYYPDNQEPAAPCPRCEEWQERYEANLKHNQMHSDNNAMLLKQLTELQAKLTAAEQQIAALAKGIIDAAKFAGIIEETEDLTTSQLLEICNDLGSTADKAVAAELRIQLLELDMESGTYETLYAQVVEELGAEKLGRLTAESLLDECNNLLDEAQSGFIPGCAEDISWRDRKDSVLAKLKNRVRDVLR